MAIFVPFVCGPSVGIIRDGPSEMRFSEFKLIQSGPVLLERLRYEWSFSASVRMFRKELIRYVVRIRRRIDWIGLGPR